MAYRQIVVERDGGTTRIILNRPEKLNALTSVMSDELFDAFQDAGEDEGVRAVVVTGAGRGFCAGQDLSEFEAAYRAGRRPDIREHLEKGFHRLIPLIVETPKPVIAGVNGVAAGAGISLAAACDIRIASEQARFTQAFVKIGLVPDSGGTWLLPRLVGAAKALELSMTGDVIDAGEALRIGLVNRVVGADDFAGELASLAAGLGSLPTVAIGQTKALFQASGASTLQQALEAEAGAQTRMAQTDDHLEGVMAFAEKREPRFQGR